MTGRCSKCKEMCEVDVYPGESYYGSNHGWLCEPDEYESNCCGAPLIEDGEQSHED